MPTAYGGFSAAAGDSRVALDILVSHPGNPRVYDMVASLVRQESWTEKELEDLAAEIQRARKEKSR